MIYFIVTFFQQTDRRRCLDKTIETLSAIKQQNGDLTQMEITKLRALHLERMTQLQVNFNAQSTTPPSSKYHTTLFKVPHHPLQSTTQPSSKYHTTIFKVPRNPLQSTTPPSSKYHTETLE